MTRCEICDCELTEKNSTEVDGVCKGYLPGLVADEVDASEHEASA